MSPLGLYYSTVDIIDEFLSDVKHLNGMVCVKTTVSKKICGSSVVIHVRTRTRSMKSMCYTTLVHIKSEANIVFLHSILHHTKALYIDLYRVTVIADELKWIWILMDNMDNTESSDFKLPDSETLWWIFPF